MANTKNIRHKIFSVNNTKKITKTMEMVAITKVKKIRKKLLICQPYLHNIKKIISHFFQGNMQYFSTLLKQSIKIHTIGIIIISSNRGLCGNLNNNIFKLVISIIKKYHKKNVNCHLYIFGLKGASFFKKNCNCNIKKIINFDENTKHTEIISLIKSLIRNYQNQQLNEIIIISNKYNNQLLQTPHVYQLIPLQSKNFSDEQYTKYNSWDYIYEPNSTVTIDWILEQYLIFKVFQLSLENILCEQSARMLTMKTATDNSEKVITNLNILYNKIRQSSITQELIEIISGSSIIF